MSKATKRYQHYKDSDIEWIGEIPEHWLVRRIKDLVNPYKYYQVGDGDHGSITPDMYLPEGEIPYIRVQNLTWLGSILDEGLVYISRETQQNNLKSKLLPNDILIAKTGATIGKIGIIPLSMKEANTTSSVGKLTVDIKYFLPKYILYVFMSKQITEQIWRDASQKSAQPGFNIDDLVDFKIVVPRLEEQKNIVFYLDKKTAQIDDLITKKERMSELLKEERTAIINNAVTKGLDSDVKMKDSGIEWLGEIPAHWEIKKLKYLSKKIGSGVTPKGGAAVYQLEGILFLRSQNIHFDGLKLEDVVYISEDIHKEMSTTKLLPGDVLLNITGASIGRCYFYPSNMGEANVNQHVCIIRPNSKSLTKYVNYCLSSEVGQQQIVNNQNGISREGLNFEELGSFKISTPDTNEQKRIIAYLDRKTKLIYDQIDREERSIELLKEYRTALISEVVTGKVDIRNYGD